MNSREYYSRIEGVIRDCPIITHFSIDFDEIDECIGYLKGRLEFIDGSSLYFIEFIEIQNNIAIHLKYKYQWQSGNGNLITRWDNVPHHPDVDTFPDHMHDNHGVHTSRNMDLETVINEIMDKIIT